ncbi:hypothetical protein D1AOALGA4SA_1644 [Olavius algarvensis Delta 1 endosymbiont]|nr:hypothetical protein D1AOALGA4SA_1644 [Olavius algarvensis Delta 1 endosymbiont]
MKRIEHFKSRNPYPAPRNPHPAPRTPQLATRNQIPEDREQKSEDRYFGFKSFYSTRHALCALPYVT